MKFSIFFLASIVSAAQLAAADQSTEVPDSMALLDSLYDTDECFTDCNDKYLGKKSDTKTKKIESKLDSCYEDCMYDKDGRRTRYARSIGSRGVEEVLDCTGSCAKKAEKKMKKEEKKNSKGSKEYGKCKDKCSSDDKKKCEKKCNKDEDKRKDKADSKAKKSARKSADKCSLKCLEDLMFQENVAVHSEAKTE